MLGETVFLRPADGGTPFVCIVTFITEANGRAVADLLVCPPGLNPFPQGSVLEGGAVGQWQRKPGAPRVDLGPGLERRGEAVDVSGQLERERNTGIDLERARVVSWLREMEGTTEVSTRTLAQEIADQIELGAHVEK